MWSKSVELLNPYVAIKQGMNMTRDQMIALIQNNHNVHITHTLFSDNEYIFSAENGNVYDENGYLFEDWYSPNNVTGWNGIRERTGGRWEDGWSIKK